MTTIPSLPNRIFIWKGIIELHTSLMWLPMDASFGVPRFTTMDELESLGSKFQKYLLGNVSKKWEYSCCWFRHAEKQLRLVVYPTIFISLSHLQPRWCSVSNKLCSETIPFGCIPASILRSNHRFARDLHDLFFLLKSMPFNELANCFAQGTGQKQTELKASSDSLGL